MKGLFASNAVFFTLMLCQPHIGLAQLGGETKALQEDIKALKEGQISIQKDLQEIKKLLQARPAQPAKPPAEFKEAVITIDGAPSKGDKNAKLAFLEFSDYQ